MATYPESQNDFALHSVFAGKKKMKEKSLSTERGQQAYVNELLLTHRG